MKLLSGQWNWMYIVKSDAGEETLIQLDWDYPHTATSFGWIPQCKPPNDPIQCGRSTDGTVDCELCGKTASEFIADAREYLDTIADNGESYPEQE